MDMTVAKGRDGFKAVTRIPMGPVEDELGRSGERILRVVTSKTRGGIDTTASAVLCEEGFSGYSFLLFGDYHKTIEKSDARCTEKAVRALHERALSNIEAVVAEAKAFYVKKAEEAAARKAVAV